MDAAGRLLGRAEEQRRIAAVVSGARNGIGGALLLTGEPGIGKTSLLDAALVGLTGVQILTVDGYEAESTMPYAALERLVTPLRGHLPALSEHHQLALRTATGTAAGPPPDRFLVGLGILGLLGAAGRSGPVVCAVDDAHWLDSESLDVLAFVARRIRAESAALLFAARDDPATTERMSGVPTLGVDGLDDESAVKLLMASLPVSIDPLAAAQIATATGGNPLALRDLATELSARQLVETSLSEEPIPVGHRLETLYLRQVRQLEPDEQLWMLVAAADSTGNMDLIKAAAQELGVSATAGEAIETAGLVELGTEVRFRHPLVRSAAYNAPHGADRRRVHRALSRAADEMGLAELEAWHAARAALGTDDAVAARLERAADQAASRGGFFSRASVLARAAELTSPGARKDERLVAAAEAALAAGAAQVAKGLLDEVDEDAVGPVLRGRMLSVRAALAVFTADPALMHGTADMLRAAACFHGHDADREQQALIKAFDCVLASERLTEDVTLAELGARLGEGAELRPGPRADVLRALSAHILLPYADAVPVIRRAVDTLLRVPPEELLGFGPASVALTTALWDEPARRRCLQRTAETARNLGSLQLLDTTLWIMSLAELYGGTPRRAGELMEQVRDLRRAIGYDAEHVINVALLAWTDAPRQQVEMIADGAAALGFGGVRSSAVGALGVRDITEGHYRDARLRLEPLLDDPFLQVTPLEYPDYVEAAVRSGRPERAAPYVARLEEMAGANGSPWTTGVAQRSRALLAPDEAAEESYTAAITTLSSAGLPVELARAHLVYGEWLRRAKRRRDARVQLRAAVEKFDRAGATSFARRSRSELEATGERPGEGVPRRAHELTAQEATVARLAAAGNTNAEIGATLFISGNTVDYHLRKVFQKLGVSSRRQLAEHLDD